MWKSLIAALVIAAAWPTAAPAMQGASSVAFRQPSPDQSTGPYNPNAPQGGTTAQGWPAA
jgi:hypothetical protein